MADLTISKVDPKNDAELKAASIALWSELLPMLISGDVEVTMKRKRRTKPQNASIHLYCNMLSTAYNDAGFDQQVVLAQQAAVPWSMPTVKENQWRRIQLALGLPKSTADLDTPDVTRVHEVLNRHTIEKFGINIAFPSMESMSFSHLAENT